MSSAVKLRPPAKPFLKWAGGKRRLLPKLRSLYPKTFGVYHEPFLGGGAVFWDLAPVRAELADANQRLTRAWTAVRDDVDGVIGLLRQSPHTKDFYLKVRALDIDKATNVNVAAWLIYLNKTGFNGLYRVNKSGRFNVPFGKYSNPTICDGANLRACSRTLEGVTLRCASFEKVLDRAVRGDFVYFDPPYLPTSATSSFTAYTAGGFGLADHRRLRDVARELKARGVHVLISNCAAPPIVELYADGFDVTTVRATRSIASKGDRRGNVAELLIR